MAGKMGHELQDQELWKRMLERAQNDEAFREALRTDPVNALVRESGLSPDELRQHIGAMSDDDLANVAGGSSGGRWKCSECGLDFESELSWELWGKLHQAGCRLFAGKYPFP